MKKNNLKLTILLIAILTTISLLAGCGSSTTTSGGNGYKDGTYEGISEAGIHGEIKVEVTVEGESISDISIISHNETEGIGTIVFDKYPELIIEAQSTEVDNISGATVTSEALKEAVSNALEEAK
ncbi:FMN-binding protein [Alkalibaculum sp. M08DMB]|uniref:FMN-binding protein n=1 Tax=Alkalibaculum sporogenes TaxID=2655001 RepID=A0A6A7KDC9_9FIRM|nr:FMN-binding protein [Alkalibaculum sporogenes]MPW27023.1 FMN-binding protein [Alkalibaculum sporogenes]